MASAAADENLLGAVDLSQALQVIVAPDHPDQVAAALALTGMLHGRVIELIDSREKVRRDIVARMQVEEAKSILMAQRGLTEPQAMRQLQEISRRNNQKLEITAAKIVASQRMGGNGS